MVEFSDLFESEEADWQKKAKVGIHTPDVRGKTRL